MNDLPADASASEQAPDSDALPILDSGAARCVVLIGNPNAGKTALFNVLTGLRAKTANFPGVTVDMRRGRLGLSGVNADVVDLPGLYSLNALSPEEQVAESALRGDLRGASSPDAVILVVDATNVERNLYLASEILDMRLPTVVALNLIDAAKSSGIDVDVEKLSRDLNAPVVAVSSRTGEGLQELREAIRRILIETPPSRADHRSCVEGCTGCTFAARYEWAERVASGSVQDRTGRGAEVSRMDRWLTGPVAGLVAFFALMLAMFYLVFALADIPMALIESGFGRVSAWVDGFLPTEPVAMGLWFPLIFGLAMGAFAMGYRFRSLPWNRRRLALAVVVSAALPWLPVGDFRSLIIDGVLAGVGGVVVFLPQICILFLVISLLEDSGYMARAAFVMERLMRKVGLPGKAFVPMLSAHACAIPGIMAARVIEDRRDRLVTILVLPLLTCSARLPVYAMVAAMLFHDRPAWGAATFVGAYMLGISAALLTAFVLKKSVLQGESAAMVLELPPFRTPSLRNALMTVYDRAMIFLKKAGSVILLLSVGLWAVATYPKVDVHDLPQDAAASVTGLRMQADQEENPDDRDALHHAADRALAQHQLAHSYAGRLGRAVEPVFAPLGFDWKINVGVISSFAAREVVISTLAIIYGIDDEDAEDTEHLVDTLRKQQRPDGSPVFSMATCLSLLVFYVLAMQCLPTQAVTRRETGSWKWAFLQLGYMTVLAYAAALMTYQIASLFVSG